MMARRYLTKRQKAECLLRFNGRCATCGEKFKAGEPIEWDHLCPLVFGGSNDLENWGPKHPACHKPKSIAEHKAAAKSNRIRKKLAGVVKTKRRIQSPGFRTDIRRKINGATEPRVGRAHIA